MIEAPTSVGMSTGFRPLVLRAHGGNSGDEEPIVVDRSPFSVGRRADNDAQIARPDISGCHSVLEFAGEQWNLRDCESTNGTFLNGKRVGGTVAVQIGDVVHFATKGFQLSEDASSPSRPSFATKVLGDTSEIRNMLDLVDIVNQQRSYPYFQVVQDLRTGTDIGWEALGRAHSKDRPLGPGQLFSLAARNKVEAQLSQCFRQSARTCTECRHCWPKNQRPFLFLNLHPAEMQGEPFDAAMDQLVRSNLRTQYKVVLELPEMWVGNTGEVTKLVRRIRQKGMLVAYDDFGSGQSRIADLISVPPDFLKLDRSLIASLNAIRVKHSLVKAVVDACSELGVRTLGEGIETAEERQACLDMGIELGQGYFLARPAPAYQIFNVDTDTLPPQCPFVKLDILPDRTV